MVLYVAVLFAAGAGAEEKTKTSFCDPEDCAFDVSSFLDQPFGFIPTVVPVTEPAVGAGAAVVPVFINLPENGEGKPDIWGVGGMRTSNGSEALFAGHSGYWMDGRLHTLVGGVDGSINLDFHGLGQNVELSGQPLTYNIDMTGGMVAGYWALDCEKRWNVGLEYTYAEVNLSVPDLASSFRVRGDPTGQRFGLDLGQRRDAHGFSSEIGSLGLNLSYDSRNNIFTPTQGFYSGLIVTFNSEAFGGSSEYERYQWTNLYYTPLFTDKLILGVKADLQSSSGDIPIYMRPYVQLRGAPAMRYQGAHVAYAETELRWQFTDRWSVLGFGGIGATWSERRFLSDNDTTWTGGLGLRYLIARKYGLHMGLDVAYGEEGPACYLQFGSAWFKP